MADYEQQYKQAQVQIIKLKDQIKKLQDEIRERCQSYLIHSSRYRSKNSISQRSNAQQANQDSHKLKIQHKAVNVSIEASYQQQPSNMETLTYHLPSNASNQNIQRNQSINAQYQNSLNHAQPLHKQTSLQTGLLPKSNSSLPSQHSNTKSNESLLKQIQQRNSRQIEQIKQEQRIKWEQILSGCKTRLSESQKQKSQLSQRVIDLEQQLNRCKKQMKASLQAGSAMKKKPTKTQFVQTSESSINGEQTDKNSNKSIDNKSIEKKASQKSNQNKQSIEKQLGNLWATVKYEVNLDKCKNVQGKIAEICKYISQTQKKVYELKEKQSKYKQLQQSKVQQYNYSTPYRKLKNGDSQKQSNSKDTYNQNEVQLLRKKCKQLQEQLSQSRAEKYLSTPATPHQKTQNHSQQVINQKQQQEQQNQQSQQIHEPPYLIQQQLQKPTDPYIKRSFVRKKVVKRNLSAMLLRSPSKSKAESKEAIMAQLQKLQGRLQKSKDGRNDKQIASLSRKLQKLEKNVEKQPIDQVSDDNSSVARTSGISEHGFTQIIQIETQGPGFKNYTAHIFGLNNKQKNREQVKQKK